MIGKFLSLLVRKKKPVLFGDLERVKPVSDVFGFDRGTPIDRYYIEKFLENRKSLIRGRVLEIAESHYTPKFGSGDVTSEVLHVSADNPQATIIGDLTDPSTLPTDLVDCFICTQTLNFIFDFHKAVTGARQVLKPGGVLLGTVGSISQISRFDMDRWGDYWRFTTLSLQKILTLEFPEEGVEVESFGNVLAAIAFLQGIAVEDLPDRKLLDQHDPDYQVLIAFAARKEVA